jgi:hypothetical protein
MNSQPKLTSFIKTITNLKSILTEKKTPIIRDAAIKRYELCYELAWKSVPEALKTRDIEVYPLKNVLNKPLNKVGLLMKKPLAKWFKIVT